MENKSEVLIQNRLFISSHLFVRDYFFVRFEYRTTIKPLSMHCELWKIVLLKRILSKWIFHFFAKKFSHTTIYVKICSSDTLVSKESELVICNPTSSPYKGKSQPC